MAADDSARATSLKRLIQRRHWQRWRIYEIGTQSASEEHLEELLAAPAPKLEAIRHWLQTKLITIPERRHFLFRTSSSADELARISDRLASLPRDPLMRKEVSDAIALMAGTKGEAAQPGMETVLLWLLTAKAVPYTSGMAQALAPFFLLELPLHTIYDCFYRYCALQLPHLTHPIELEQREHMLDNLLLYHDPALAAFLFQWVPDWTHRSVPLDFFYSNLYRTVPPASFLYILDAYLVHGDMEFGLFVVLAIVMLARDTLLAQNDADNIRSLLKPLYALDDVGAAKATVVLATLLKRRTPSSYTTMWHARPHPTFTAASATAPPVDMSVWEKQESKTLTGRFYWVHKKTKRAQWEHPSAAHDPPPPLMCLSISTNEVAAAACIPGAKTDLSLRYFIVDCRGRRSSEDMKSGGIPSGYTLDPAVFDSPEMMESALATLLPLRSNVHLVLVGHGVTLPMALITDDETASLVREGIREDVAIVNRAALWFQKHGFRFVSCLDGGYAAWHAFLRDTPQCTMEELVGHVVSECRYCKVDARAAAVREKKQPARRRSSIKMPTLPASMTRLSLTSSSSGGSSRLSFSSKDVKGKLGSFGAKFLRKRSNSASRLSSDSLDLDDFLADDTATVHDSASDDDEEIEIALPTLSA
ncbi:hypothetical protein SPRG_06938 [Saprolegnia parasitica CBS 223.65]|uniref:TBC1 domain family member 23 n=1 Tax=Saprolegnia parasitica (strain CBS 223.65) TaxID=695850 RepID=A0A067CDU4_SAPPC|nr:hypothetical protein SPRG_06938 [Saprolegnia parasitica CBS 223.65]KDO27350.1 hypothetical protein SPRG_06938 [Saprolegnia parasitica CBS 223.65]|eukprot:XP_012201794.1 hypothetical protein SPRG_06938 [Saprolegnia parasitica CBS 223.65]